MDERIEILKKYNFWQGESFDNGRPRSLYTDNIASYIGNRLVKVLVGQRRTGKSYILRQIAKKLIDNGIPAQNTLLINRELTDFDFLRSYKELDELIKLYHLELKPQGTVYILIDEIQIIDGWERIVNSLSQDYVDQYEMFISGSNSKMLSGELATLLSGRYVCFEILPYGYDEYLDVTGDEHGRQSYLKYMVGGGLPELFALSTDELKRNYISAIKDTVLLRDVIQRHNIRDPKLLEDIFLFLVINASNLVSVGSIVKYFKGQGRKTTYDLISTYIGYIEDTFLVHRCERYDLRDKEAISGNAKFYTNDHSYKNYLYANYGYGVGYLLENLIYLELRRAGFDVKVGTLKGREIDFVAQKADRIIYLQSTYMLIDEQTIDREHSALQSINDNYEKYVVSIDDIAHPSKGGIKHIQAWNLTKILW